MDAATAAAKCKVTTETIRTWCRQGVIAATKQAGRWIIDPKSLRTHRRRLTALRQARRARAAAAIQAHITSQLVLPPLTGSDKQIAWAADIRARHLVAALNLVTHDAESGQPASRATYRLATPTMFGHDPLNAAGVIGADAYTEHVDEAAYLTALHTVLAARTDARYWINNR
ncbi:helix-turn-helix domain-containing protein [Streptomyces sp. NPDC006610]|uniref:helix-turn-helix domain-containing protein n=1 Tax=Streptomyces sp. NPDC006610 TaxID=3154584 RepID=UPI0033AB93DC